MTVLRTGDIKIKMYMYIDERSELVEFSKLRQKLYPSFSVQMITLFFCIIGFWLD